MKLLTPRQREALTWAANGYTSRQIAQKMYITYNTAIDLLQQAYRALDAKDRAHAVGLGLKLAEISVDDIHHRDDTDWKDAA